MGSEGEGGESATKEEAKNEAEQTRALDGAVGGAGLSVNERGAVVQSLGNTIKAICFDKNLSSMFRFNELTDRVEVSGAWWTRSSTSLSDNDLNNIRLYLEQNYGLSHEKNIPRAVDIVAHQHSFHPVRQFLEELRWDGVKRIGNLLPKYLGADRSDYTEEALKLFMLGAIERVFAPGTKFEIMVCFVEDKQGGGKSTIARFLATDDDWFSDDVKNLDDENIYRKLQGHWIIEFSEMLATSNTKTIEAIKSFLSRQKDTYKVPYDKYPHDFPRQCVFIGTSNNLDFLPNDRTGNRRFIPILADSKRAEIHPLDNEEETRAYIVQAWAEAMEIYRSGEYSLTLPKNLQGTLLKVQRDFTPEDPKVGIIQDWLDCCSYDSVCSLMLYKEALGNEYQEPKSWELREIGGIMNRSIVGWMKHPSSDSQVRFPRYGKQRAWDRIVHEKASTKDFVNVDEGGQQIELPFS